MATNDKLINAMGAQVLPGVFNGNLNANYPDYITARGYGSEYNNARADLLQREVANYRQTAIDADTQKAAGSIVGLFMTAATLSGKKLTEQELAQVAETAKRHAGNIEIYLNIAKMLGITEQGCDYIRRAFYGDKGSTVHAFDSTYNSLKGRVGHEQALKMANNVATYQFGRQYSKEFMHGMSADDYAATQSFLLENGGLAGFLNSDSSSLMDLRKQANIAARAADPNATKEEIAMGMGAVAFDKNTSMGRHNLQAAKMIMSGYEDDLKELKYGDIVKELGDKLEPGSQKAFKNMAELDDLVGKMGKDYKVHINTTEKDVNKGVEDITTQFEAMIKKAEERKDKAAIARLKGLKDKVTDQYKKCMELTDAKDINGKRLTSFQAANVNSYEVKRAAGEQTNAAIRVMSTYYAAEGKARRAIDEAEERGDTEAANKHREELAQIQYDTQKFASSNRAAARVYEASKGDNTAEIRKQALFTSASSVMNAMAAQGKPIQLAEALQASKVLMPVTADTSSLASMSEVIQKGLAGLTERGGSVEQYLSQMSSGRRIAENFGLGVVGATMAADMGQMANKYGAEIGLSLADQEKSANNRTTLVSEAIRKNKSIVQLRQAFMENKSKFEEVRGKLDPEKQAQLDNLIKKMDTSNGSAEWTGDDRHMAETILSDMGYTYDQRFNANSSFNTRAESSNKQFLANVGNAGVLEEVMREVNYYSGASEIFGDGGASKVFTKFAPNMIKVNDILKNGNMSAKERKDAINDLIEDSNLTNEEKEKMRKANEKGLIERYADNEDFKDAMVQINAAKNHEDDERLALRAQARSEAFSAREKGLNERLTELATSGKLSSDPEEAKKQITEVFGNTMNDYQKLAAMDMLAEHGAVKEGAKYKDASGKEKSLTQRQIDIVKYKKQHAGTVRDLIEGKGDNAVIKLDNGMVVTAKELRDNEAEYAVYSSLRDTVGFEGNAAAFGSLIDGGDYSQYYSEDERKKGAEDADKERFMKKVNILNRRILDKYNNNIAFKERIEDEAKAAGMSTMDYMGTLTAKMVDEEEEVRASDYGLESVSDADIGMASDEVNKDGAVSSTPSKGEELISMGISDTNDQLRAMNENIISLVNIFKTGADVKEPARE